MSESWEASSHFVAKSGTYSTEVSAALLTCSFHSNTKQLSVPQLPRRHASPIALFQRPFFSTRNKPSLQTQLLHLPSQPHHLATGGCLARQPHFFTASKRGRCLSALSPPSCLMLSIHNTSGSGSILEAADKVSSSRRLGNQQSTAISYTFASQHPPPTAKATRCFHDHHAGGVRGVHRLVQGGLA